MRFFRKTCFISILCCTFFYTANAQSWNGKQCAVVLTYDDAIDIDLDNVVPALDSFGLKGTFYIIGSSPVVTKRIPEWRKAAMGGHELGNHTSFHPCNSKGRSFVTPETDLSLYTLRRIHSDALLTNTLLSAIDGKKERTFAFPCGDKKIGDTLYYEGMKQSFVAARGVTGGLKAAVNVDLSDINCYSINGQDANYMIGLVKKAQQEHALLVFLFHGVGGGHGLNVARAEHTKLLQYLKEQENNIWIAPMIDVAKFVRTQQP
jgi:peptidoglycan/xylan/chitin deacetylase (PgdA/CDA1 family)